MVSIVGEPDRERRGTAMAARRPSDGTGGVGATGMWTFLATDAMGFGGLLIAYGVLRVRAGVDTWPDPRARLALAPAAAMTFALLLSSLTMTLATRAPTVAGAAGLAARDAGARRRVPGGRRLRVRPPAGRRAGDGADGGPVRVDVLRGDRLPRAARARGRGGGRASCCARRSARKRWKQRRYIGTSWMRPGCRSSPSSTCGRRDDGRRSGARRASAAGNVSAAGGVRAAGGADGLRAGRGRDGRRAGRPHHGAGGAADGEGRPGAVVLHAGAREPARGASDPARDRRGGRRRRSC